jgi:hypothetical protein
MALTEQQAGSVLFYLCANCTEAASDPEVEQLKDFFNFQKVKYIIFEAKCCNCSADINGLHFTAQLPMPASSMIRAYPRWHSAGYCYFPGISETSIKIGI